MTTEKRERPRLGVNVDHVATLRQQRDTMYPDPVFAGSLAELAGADQITIHLREDRRHIQDRDLRLMRETTQTALNLEMAATRQMVDIALATGPDTVTLVPEKREERTTEGGLDVLSDEAGLSAIVEELKQAGITVSLFVDPDTEQIEASKRVGATVVELHTGDYCDAKPEQAKAGQLDRIKTAARHAAKAGLAVVAGHGLDYTNVASVAAIPEIEELNIGHSLVSRAVFVGFERAVREMIQAIEKGC